MSNIAIRVDHLGKQYKLGGQQIAYTTFREELIKKLQSPIRLLKGGFTQDKNLFWALDDVSFEVKHGEAIGIIGRNGAGKSTLLKILSRITSPTRGRVDIYGRVGSLLEVGTGFHPELSGRENIFLNGAILGMSRMEITRKFDEIVDFSGVEKFLDTPVKHYSSGMFVRLAFAVAAHLEPEILIVDEVLAVGDAEFQKKCLGKMDDVANEGRTVLFVSHNMGAISDLCKKGIIINSGSLIFEGEIKEVIEKYMSEKSNSRNYDLGNLPRDKVWEGKHKSINISTRNSFQEIQSEFQYGELINVKIRILSKETEMIYIGIGIRDSLGKQLLHFNNRDQHSGFYAKSGINDLGLSFKNLLNYGTYYITIWIGDSHFQGQDYLSDCLFFTSNTHLLGDIYSKGSIILDCTWDFGVLKFGT